MEWLSGWLKSIILVVLLAVFLDLLLPNQTMQRYVRTVMSLFIVLTLMSPLFSLMDVRPQIERRLASGLLLQNQAAGGGELRPVAGIRSDAEAFRSKQQEQSLRLVESQAAEVMKQQLEQSLRIRVASIRVKAELNGQGQPALSGVEVLAANEAAEQKAAEQKAAERKAAGARGGSAPALVEPIEPIAPVAIDIRPGGEALAPHAEAAAAKAESPELAQKRTQIVSLIVREWQLDSEQVRVDWREPDAPS
ncbi:stage III sporulation protein AF [Paenibacillus ginsengihumi]|uniref:stage III sporulation protein AF n=1 Tax=Paenibacillus ginsengihumi TaxID=431596 RepID=UPI00037A8590|nr:stage III sporulation protein AF [Paenibacillus ginsengihumi]